MLSFLVIASSLVVKWWHQKVVRTAIRQAKRGGQDPDAVEKQTRIEAEARTPVGNSQKMIRLIGTGL